MRRFAVVTMLAVLPAAVSLAQFRPRPPGYAAPSRPASEPAAVAPSAAADLPTLLKQLAHESTREPAALKLIEIKNAAKVQTLMDALPAADVPTRLAIYNILGRSGDKSCLDVLASAAAASSTTKPAVSPAESSAALAAVAQLDPAKAGDIVVSLLDPSREARQLALGVKCSQFAGEKAGPALAAVLKTPNAMDSTTAFEAARRLSALDQAMAVKELAAAALVDDSNNWPGSSAAVFALSGMRTPAAVDAIVEALKSGPSTSKHSAIRALLSMRTTAGRQAMIDALHDPDLRVRYTAATSLGVLGDPAATAALTELAQHDPEPNVRTAASEALDAIKQRPTPVAPSSAPTSRPSLTSRPSIDGRELAAALAELKDPARKAAAIERLGLLRDPRAVEPLAVFLKDPDQQIVRLAAKSLGRTREPKAFDPLAAALADKGASSAPASQPAAAAALRSQAQSAIMEAMIRTDRARAQQALLDAINGPDKAKASLAAEWLAHYADKSSAEGIKTALLERQATGGDVFRRLCSAYLRAAPGPAAELLERLAMEGKGESAVTAAATLARTGGECAAAATRLLESASPGVRIAAANGMGDSRLPEYMPALVKALKDAEARVRVEAAESLGELRLPEAIPALEAASKDSDKSVQKAAASAIATIKRHATSQPLPSTP